MGNDGHGEGIEGVDLGCGLRRVQDTGRYEVFEPNCYTALYTYDVSPKSLTGH